MIKFNKTKLENGLEIYHVPVNPGSKVISVDVFYKVGSRNEVMGKSGIAHMLEHLNFKSTKNLRAGEFDEIVKGFGGVNNASTGFDYTHYFIKASNENLDKTLGLFAELMKNLSLKDKRRLGEYYVTGIDAQPDAVYLLSKNFSTILKLNLQTHAIEDAYSFSGAANARALAVKDGKFYVFSREGKENKVFIYDMK